MKAYSFLLLGEQRTMTPLCYKCASTKSAFEGSVTCDHDDDERAFESVYTGVELQYAIAKQGYKVVNVSAIVYFPEYQMNLFWTILTYFSKLKICSKGWPKEDMTPQDKQAYVDQLNLDTGFHDITVEDINYSPAKVTIAKLIINSLLGKGPPSQRVLCKVCVFFIGCFLFQVSMVNSMMAMCVKL